jgi:hypothetical protein
MKKTFLLGFAVLLALALVSCDFFAGPEQIDEVPNVVYSPDGRQVTLRLDGQGGPSKNMSRALTDNLAKAGHDYFEVVFYDGTDVARASWELGDAAGIRNVPREYDYDTAGKAILFVGRKVDKTLLAIGLLTAVDGSGTFISATSETATFTVAALTAGADPDQGTLDAIWAATTAGPPTKDPPTFITGDDAGGDPDGDDTEIVPLADANTGAVFPLYKIAAGKPSILASYTIGSTHSFAYTGTGPYTFTGGINPYLPGIIIAAIPPPIVPKVPRFPRGGGLYWYAAAPHALSTKITITNNSTAGALFVAGTTFKIETDDISDKEGVISFCFDIPVNAIIGGTNALTWHIRPGFGTNQYDLDNGYGSAGGSILLGVGDDITLNWLWVTTN